MAMQRKKNKPSHGDRVYEVEWCQELPVDEHGDDCMDEATMVCSNFSTIEKARAYAKKVFPLNQLHGITITLMEFVPYDEDDPGKYGPHVGFWEAVADSEYYEG